MPKLVRSSVEWLNHFCVASMWKRRQLEGFMVRMLQEF